MKKQRQGQKQGQDEYVTIPDLTVRDAEASDTVTIPIVDSAGQKPKKPLDYAHLKPHPAAELFPEMPKPQRDKLYKDIRDHGLRTPIELLDGQIIDGRNRYDAILHTGKDTDPKSYVEIQTDDPIAYVLSKNLHRRHLTKSQRAAIAADAKEMYAARAKERQKLSKGRGKKKVGKNLHTLNGKARDQAGKAFDVAGYTVDKAEKVKKTDPKLFEKVKQGEVTLETAVRRVKENSKTPMQRLETKIDKRLEDIQTKARALQGSIWALHIDMREHGVRNLQGTDVFLCLCELKEVVETVRKFTELSEEKFGDLPTPKAGDIIEGDVVQAA